MEITKKVEIVAGLQRMTAEVFDEVVAGLKVGMSEADIAEAVRVAFKNRGVDEFWYTVPTIVLIGPERFIEGTLTADYGVKAPSDKVRLGEGSVVHIDFSPMHPATKIWGDWSRTIVFRPRKGVDDEQMELLKEVREIQLEGIKHITAETTGADIASYYLNIFKGKGMTLQDVRKNVGHSIHAGPKDKADRIWLDTENQTPLGEGIYTIEPGVSRPARRGPGLLVARFEDCIYTPKTGPAMVL